jgi:hypothetical protein
MEQTDRDLKVSQDLSALAVADCVLRFRSEGAKTDEFGGNIGNNLAQRSGRIEVDRFYRFLMTSEFKR